MSSQIFGAHGAVILFLTMCLAACSPASAPEAPPAATDSGEVLEGTKLSITDPWAATTPNGAAVAAGYLVVTNPTVAADTLVSAASPRATRVEIHEMKMEGEMMRMRAVEKLEAPAGGAVVLAPGGYHLMFIGIDAPFEEAQSIPLTLTFANAGAIKVAMPVRDRMKAKSGADADGGHAGH
jgi:periplasmic copper chaperone A